MRWIGFLLLSLAVAVGCGGQNNAPSNKRGFSRAEFEKLVKGKSKDEIKTTLGEPLSTYSPNANEVHCLYADVIKDPSTMVTDARIEFVKDKAAAVSYPNENQPR
ncbi:MAG: hypothetical protein L0215_24720 [Gemmataceae bacterium]|nr:hypothetical protein [Gemmataceae bacterium]